MPQCEFNVHAGLYLLDISLRVWSRTCNLRYHNRGCHEKTRAQRGLVGQKLLSQTLVLFFQEYLLSYLVYMINLRNKVSTVSGQH